MWCVPFNVVRLYSICILRRLIQLIIRISIYMYCMYIIIYYYCPYRIPAIEIPHSTVGGISLYHPLIIVSCQ